MKVIKTTVPVTTDEMFDYLKKNLNPQFKERRQSDVDFEISREGNTIEINNRELYEEYLFSITVEGKEITITTSEHYVDDINAITLDSIMYNLFQDYPGEEKVSTETA